MKILKPCINSYKKITFGRLLRKILYVTFPLMSLVALPQISTAASTCEDGGKLFRGSYFVHNNSWGNNTGSGWTCSWDWAAGSDLGFGSTWDWNGDYNSVKAYPAAVLGWHWGTWSNNSNLPKRIWDDRNISTTMKYDVWGDQRINVAYDLFFHTKSNPTWQDYPTDELMIWLGRYGENINPIGSYQKTVNIEGYQWDLHRGTAYGDGRSWSVYSFLPKSNIKNFSDKNLKPFINNIVYTQGWMSNSKWLTSVQAGAEVFTTNGQGGFDVERFKAIVQ